MPPGPPASALQVFQGIILAQRDRFARPGALPPPQGGPKPFGGAVTSREGYLLGLWVHECQRVFADKLVSHEDKAWVGGAIMELAKQASRAAAERGTRQRRRRVARASLQQSMPSLGPPCLLALAACLVGTGLATLNGGPKPCFTSWPSLAGLWPRPGAAGV